MASRDRIGKGIQKQLGYTIMPDDTMNLIDLPERNEVRAVGDRARRELDAILENVTLVAKIRRAAFLAYVEEGFTVDQALQLCTK
jgi:hypothetical protein